MKCTECGKEFEQYDVSEICLACQRDIGDEPAMCPTCGNMMEYVDCWNCGGDGGFHDCGEDCCCCLEPELDLNEPCGECDGNGGYLQCTALPHSKEEIER